MPTAKKRAVKAKKDYGASIKVLGKVYTARGSTAREAIEGLSVRNAKGMSVMTITKGGSFKSKILGAPLTSRLFSPSKLMREIALKHASLMFDLI